MSHAQKLFSAEPRGCAVTLARGQNSLLLVLSAEPAFTARFARRWKHACRALGRACDANSERSVEQHGDAMAVLLCPPEDTGALGLAKRIASGLFAPISAERAGAILGLSADELAERMPAPSLALRGERHGRGYSYAAYSTDDLLDLADGLEAQAAR